MAATKPRMRCRMIRSFEGRSLVGLKWQEGLASRKHAFAGAIIAGLACLLAACTVNAESLDRSFSYGVELGPSLALADYAPLYAPTVDETNEPEQQQPQVDEEETSRVRDSLVNSLIERWLDTDAASGQQVEAEGPQPMAKRRQLDVAAAPNSAYYYYDVNSHLPPTGSRDDELEPAVNDEIGGSIRGPVNEPEEFEARLGQLTDLLNHRMGNSAARQQLLMSLLAANDSSVADQTELSLGAAGPSGELATGRLSDELRAELVERLSKLLDSNSGGSGAEPLEEPRSENDTEELEGGAVSAAPADVVEASTSEYIDHPLVLFGHQLVQGGAGEGRQLLGPEGTFENIQVIKSDSAIPAYCDPPNPCPLGFTARDGCLENFINSASFSREYQAKQSCSCDNEHSLFNCASAQSAPSTSSPADNDNDNDKAAPIGGNAAREPTTSERSPATTADKLSTLARTIQNRFGDLASVRKLISEQQAASASASDQDDDSNYLVRSARKWSPDLHYHKMELD